MVDVFGAINVMKNLKLKPLSLFIQTKSLAVLRQRLESRGTDSPEKIEKRLAKAEIEMEEFNQFDITIINDDLHIAQQQLAIIVDHFLTREN